MGCGAAAEVQSKKGARQSLCCVTRAAPTPPRPHPPVEPRVLRCPATCVLGYAPLGCQMSPSALSPDWMPQLSPDDDHHSRQMVPKRPQERKKKAIEFPCAHCHRGSRSQSRDKTRRGGVPHGSGPKGTVDEQHRGTRAAADGHTASEPATRTTSWGIGYFLASVPPRATSLQTRCGRRYSSGTLSRGCFDKNFCLRLRQAGGEDKSRQGASWSPNIAAISSGPESSEGVGASRYGYGPFFEVRRGGT